MSDRKLLLSMLGVAAVAILLYLLGVVEAPGQ